MISCDNCPHFCKLIALKNNTRHILFLVVFTLFGPTFLWSQTGFTLPKDSKGGKIKFELVNNLILLPVEVNNVKLSFVLDTGVSSTLLFGAAKDSLQLKQTSKVMFRGLGGGDEVEAIKSNGNNIRVGKAVDKEHSLYVVFNEDLNFSHRMGVPIHGVLGYDFFKNFIVSINYQKKIIRYDAPEYFRKKKLKGFETYPLFINKRRPFINNVTVNNEANMLMLIDTGSSDGVWVFKDDDITSEKSKNYFTDFLGLGLSGSIYGKRSRVNEVKLGSFSFEDVNVAIPNNDAIVNTRMLEERKGSIGSQIMKRFTVVFDYPNDKVSFKKNSYYDDAFYYNMSGLTLEHIGVSLIKNEITNTNALTRNAEIGGNGGTLFSLIPTYDIFIAPAVVVADVGDNSAAALVDVRVGDKLLQINGKPVYEFKLHEITSIFSSKEGKLINLKLERNGVELKKKFVLKKLF